MSSREACSGLSSSQTGSGLPMASRVAAPFGPALPRPVRENTASISEILRPSSLMRMPRMTLLVPFSFSTPKKAACCVRGSRK